MIAEHEGRILEACDALFPEVIDFTRAMIGQYPVLHREQGVLNVVEERLAAGRTALRAGRPDDAIRVLGPVRDDPRVQPFWTEAVDAHVYARRELAGRWFARGVRLTGSERTAALGEAREILVALVRDYPDSVYAEPVLDALERVERALDGTR